MKVFISWSGERSLAIARALREWLPRVIQAVQPFMSESDIDKGVRWEQEIGSQLEQTKFGIFCLTPENLNSRWINFEAGAISKTIEKTYVCTYLLDLKPTDLEGPLSKFNHTQVEKEETRRLIQTIYRASQNQILSENIINDAFDVWWPRLEEKYNQLPLIVEDKKPRRELTDMVEEILSIVRTQAMERDSKDWVTDNFLSTFLPIMQSAMSNDSNFNPSPEMIWSIRELEAEADMRRGAMIRRGFRPIERLYLSRYRDGLSGETPTSDKGASPSIEANNKVEGDKDENSNS